MLSLLERLNHPALKFNQDISGVVEEICEPLFTAFGITNFGYVKIFPNGTMLRISTDEEWTKKYFSLQYYNDSHFYDFSNLAENQSQIRIYTNQPEGGVFSDLYEHNIWNIFTIYEIVDECAHVWFFATSRDKPQLVNFYINNLQVLKTFIEYFKERAKSYLTSPKSDILITTDLKIQIDKNAEAQSLINQFLEKIGKKHHFNFTLTPREIDCMQYLITGKSAKEIARSLNLSPRTVERHIDNIKRKTDCNKTSQLLKIFLDKSRH